MNEIETRFVAENAVNDSWDRCDRQHKLARNTSQPILRLQPSEVAPRLDELVERTGGRLGVFRQAAEVISNAGHSFLVADSDGVLVRLDTKSSELPVFERHGIALGSCWDERIAGTNGIAMAMSHGRGFTVRGRDHFFSALNLFACTAVPLFDAHNQMVGALNVAMVDRRNASDYFFASQLLHAASDRVQRILFERQFGDSLIVSVSSPGNIDLMRSNELVAVDEAGMILGSTANAHVLAGMADPFELRGKPFDATFGADVHALDRVPERMVSVSAADGPSVNLSVQASVDKVSRGQGWLTPQSQFAQRPVRRRLSPSFRDLAAGSATMETNCARAEAHFLRALPFVIEGESGSGKSAMVAALFDATELRSDQVLTVDCTVLGEHDSDQEYIRSIMEQARLVGALQDAGRRVSVLVFDKIDEMPAYAQAELCNLLTQIETSDESDPLVANLRILATTSHPLMDAVQDGRFREDLYYLLANTRIELPPLRERESLDTLANSLAERLAGEKVEITPEAIDAIASHAWPGNVRELRSVLQQALLEGDGGRISLIDLRASPVFVESSARPSANDRGGRAPSETPYSERAMLMDALVSARWNVSQAARKLGIGRATIHRKMKRHGISRPS